MVRAVVNLAAGDSPAGLILRQKAERDRYEAALERIRETTRDARSYEIACEALGEEVTA